MDDGQAERIRVAEKELRALRDELAVAQAELTSSPAWRRVNALRQREWELIQLAAGLVDEAEHRGQ